MSFAGKGAPLRIAFVHPDLGIGGAERLVVDAAVALQEAGHSVRLFTAHCDPSHAFDEVATGRLETFVWGDWMPRVFFGRFHVLFASLRMLWVAAWLLWWGVGEFDVIFCDQVSICIPLLRLTGSKVLFYVHFPDKLLASRNSALRSCYRAPFDWLEDLTTGAADLLVANSRFTADVLRLHVPTIVRRPLILHPTCSLRPPSTAPGRRLVNNLLGPAAGRPFFLSINRFERKKDLPLAVRAFWTIPPNLRRNLCLVLVGGWDARVEENQAVYRELEQLVSELGLTESVVLARNVSTELKLELLSNTIALVYTPKHEHFGIVPIEAMVFGKPVVASSSGGPKETVLDGETGFLCGDSADEFGGAMLALLDSEKARVMGLCAQTHASGLFGPEEFKRRLCAMVSRLASGRIQ